MIRLRPLLEGLLDARQIIGTVDQRQMRERLREIADELSAPVVFLANRPTSLQSPISRWNSARPREPALQDIVSASQKLQARKTPSPGGSPSSVAAFVAHHEAVAQQLALDRRDGAPDARIVAGRKPTQGISSRLASSSSPP